MAWCTCSGSTTGTHAHAAQAVAAAHAAAATTHCSKYSIQGSICSHCAGLVNYRSMDGRCHGQSNVGQHSQTVGYSNSAHVTNSAFGLATVEQYMWAGRGLDRNRIVSSIIALRLWRIMGGPQHNVSNVKSCRLSRLPSEIPETSARGAPSVLATMRYHCSASHCIGRALRSLTAPH